MLEHLLECTKCSYKFITVLHNGQQLNMRLYYSQIHHTVVYNRRIILEQLIYCSETIFRNSYITKIRSNACFVLMSNWNANIPQHLSTSVAQMKQTTETAFKSSLWRMHRSKDRHWATYFLTAFRWAFGWAKVRSKTRLSQKVKWFRWAFRWVETSVLDRSFRSAKGSAKGWDQKYGLSTDLDRSSAELTWLKSIEFAWKR